MVFLRIFSFYFVAIAMITLKYALYMQIRMQLGLDHPNSISTIFDSLYISLSLSNNISILFPFFGSPEVLFIARFSDLVIFIDKTCVGV